MRALCPRADGADSKPATALDPRLPHPTKILVRPLATLALLLLPALAWSQATVSGDAVAGQRKTQMCAGCHGIDGWRTAFPEVYSVPKIGNQHPAYIVKALQAYKSGERSHPSMKAIAASLSEKDMADLAAYYGGSPAPGK